MRSQVFESRREIKIVIPGHSNMSGGSFAALFTAVMLLVFFPLLRRLLRHRTGAPLPGKVLLLIIAIFIVPATLLFFGLVPSKRKSTTVKAYPGPRNRLDHAVGLAGEDGPGGPDPGCRFQHLRKARCGLRNARTHPVLRSLIRLVES
jgi:hypothetical protein